MVNVCNKNMKELHNFSRNFAYPSHFFAAVEYETNKIYFIK